MRHINNVTFDIHQGFCHIVMFIKGYVAFGVHQGLCHNVTMVKGYVVNVTFNVYQGFCRIVMFNKVEFWITGTYHNVDNIHIYE